MINNTEFTGENADSGQLKYVVYIDGERQNNTAENENNNNNGNNGNNTNNELGRYSETVVNNVNNKREVLERNIVNTMDGRLVLTNDDGNKYLFDPATQNLRNFEESIERKQNIQELKNRVNFLEDAVHAKTQVNYNSPNNVRNKLLLPIVNTIDLEEEELEEETVFVNQDFGNGEHPVVTTNVTEISSNNDNEIEVNKNNLNEVLEEINNNEEEEQLLEELKLEEEDTPSVEAINNLVQEEVVLTDKLSLQEKIIRTLVFMVVLAFLVLGIYFLIFRKHK